MAQARGKVSALLHEGELVLPLHDDTHGIFEESSHNQESWHGWDVWLQGLPDFIKDILNLSTEFFNLFFDARHDFFLYKYL